MPTFNVGNHVMLTLLSRNFRVLKFSSAKFKFMSKNTWKIQAQSILYCPVSYKFSRTAYHTRSEEGYIFHCDTGLVKSQASRYLLWLNAASHLEFKMFITCSYWKSLCLIWHKNINESWLVTCTESFSKGQITWIFYHQPKSQNLSCRLLRKQECKSQG